MKILGVALTTPGRKELIGLFANLILLMSLYLIGYMLFHYELMPGVIFGIGAGTLSKAYGIDPLNKGWQPKIVWLAFIVVFILFTMAICSL